MKEKMEFTFPSPETEGEMTIYCEKLRHPSIIGVGKSIDEAMESIEKQVKHIMRYGDYQHATYGEGRMIVSMGALFYATRDVTLYRGNVVFH
ncbi:MAG: hypothetical protein JSV63_02780 [Candidatus Aenigmatarchaeota archaeon]|nr:MAG: hypothetical protein JSV63_02780 [Candidatus Aenigmarchaeota archaeon]